MMKKCLQVKKTAELFKNNKRKYTILRKNTEKVRRKEFNRTRRNKFNHNYEDEEKVEKVEKAEKVEKIEKAEKVEIIENVSTIENKETLRIIPMYNEICNNRIVETFRIMTGGVDFNESSSDQTHC